MSMATIPAALRVNERRIRPDAAIYRAKHERDYWLSDAAKARHTESPEDVRGGTGRAGALPGRGPHPDVRGPGDIIPRHSRHSGARPQLLRDPEPRASNVGDRRCRPLAPRRGGCEAGERVGRLRHA